METDSVFKVDFFHPNNFVKKARTPVEVEWRESRDPLLVDAIRALIPVDLKENGHALEFLR